MSSMSFISFFFYSLFLNVSVFQDSVLILLFSILTHSLGNSIQSQDFKHYLPADDS